MTWGEFKRKVEELGVQDDDGLLYIDISGVEGGQIKCERFDESAGWEITDEF